MNTPPKIRLVDVIEQILAKSARFLTVDEVYAAVVEDERFVFRSGNPRGIVRNCLSRHSLENLHSCASARKLFARNSSGAYCATSE